MAKFPTASQWKQIFKILSRREKIILTVFSLLAIASLVLFAGSLYFANTHPVAAFGGTYTEGIVGQPRYINPVYGETNDIDRTLIDLVYSGLMTYDNKGNVVPDLAQSYQVSSDGRTYDFQLKKAVWSDGKPVTADDIVFTIQTIQNSAYKSPLRANWIDVSVQKTADNSVEFTLKAPYNSFLENCTLKILPKHIWQSISPDNFSLSFYNLQPIGSGPFTFSGLQQTSSGFIKSIQLDSNRQYYNHPSFIASVVFQFFQNKSDLASAASAGQLDGFSLASFDNNAIQAAKAIPGGWGHAAFNSYALQMPRYFAVFLNTQKNSLFADSNIRKALTYATDKNALIQSIKSQTGDSANEVASPILPDFYGYQQPTTSYNYNLATAGTLLDAAGFKNTGSGPRLKAINKKPAFQFTRYLKVGSTGKEVTQLQSCLSRLDDSFKTTLSSSKSGTYDKATESAVTAFQQKYLPSLKPTGETGASTRTELNNLCTPPSSNAQPLQFTLTTANQPQLLATANILQQQWQQAGFQVQINAVSVTDLKQIIKNRGYDALLYGEALGAEPDLYPFWNSSQSIDPGLNLSSYQNKTVDQLLIDARQATDPATEEQKYEALQNTIISDAPAIFLYNPDYVYWVSKSVQGVDTQKIIDPAKRFINITNWYITTKRIWK